MFLLFNLTFAGRVWLIIGLVIAVIVGIYFACTIDGSIINRISSGFIGFFISAFVVLLIAGVCSWYNTNTAAGQRNIKNDQSNMTGGLNRKITINLYGKEEPIVFEGKIDLAEKEDNKVLEFVMDGKKYIYYVGILDSYIVEEK